VKVPYLCFSAVFILLAVIFFFIHLPHIGEGKIDFGAGALKYPHVVLGIIAIFMYVGGEVSVGSAIINFLHQPTVAGLDPVAASKYVSLYWGGLLIGRFMGAVELSDMKPGNKKILLACIPLSINGWGNVLHYAPLVALCWLLFQFGKSQAGTTLMLFAMAAVVLLTVAIVAGGHLAMWCVLGIGLFTSIGWSNTFSLAIEGVGIYKSQASSLLVMAILGGALLPPLQGFVADHLGLGLSFIIPLIAYAYVAFYGAKGHNIGRASEAAG
jgi:FHS family L-fucose permease-like MFS transporter